MGVNISKFSPISQKSPFKFDPNFSTFVDNYWKEFSRKSANNPKFVGTWHDRLGIRERKARLIWGVCVGGLESQAPKCGAKIVNFRAVFAVAAGPSIVRQKEYFCTRSLALVVP